MQTNTGPAVSAVDSVMLYARRLIKYLRNLVMNCLVLINNVAWGLIPTYLVIAYHLLLPCWRRGVWEMGVSNVGQTGRLQLPLLGS